MTRIPVPPDPRYTSLPSAFNSIDACIESDQEALSRIEGEVLDGTTFKALEGVPYRRSLQVLCAGDLHLIAGQTTPVQSINSADNFSCFLAMPLSGGFITKEAHGFQAVGPGDLYLNQNYCGPSRMGYLSSLFVSLDRSRLHRTLRLISRRSVPAASGEGVLAPSLKIERGRKPGVIGTGKMWSLLSYIDSLHEDDPSLPSCMGLDDQFYRLLSFALLEAGDQLEDVRRHWATSVNDWNNPLDDLVDYIRLNAHIGLTLTDLEEQSHYSARHLQNLFKEKFNCTPMQFVRRQRLTSAMEKLQAPDEEATVTSIGRACGYRLISNFTTDFQRQFGVTPSTVLRASRRGGDDPGQ